MMQDKIELPPNRQFGLLFTVIFVGTAFYFLSTGSLSGFYTSGAAGLGVLGFTVMKPDALRPLNRLWMRLGWAIGRLVSPLILGSIYFGIFAPIAMFMRLLRRDELMLQKKNTDTFWVSRSSHTVRPNYFKDQF